MSKNKANNQEGIPESETVPVANVDPQVVAGLVDEIKGLRAEIDSLKKKGEGPKTGMKGMVEVDSKSNPKAYRALVEKYRVQNPVKFAQKKAEFEKRLGVTL